ncbi:MAG: hypothetical protein KKC43_05450 [Alphaproteobacteria bacterium]|nr:hypothetical protein [Alphaproteobacteria bacterium]
MRLSTIGRRLSKARHNSKFGFLDQLRLEQKVLQKHYGADGTVSASILDDSGAIGQLVDEFSLVCLFQLGEHWRKVPKRSLKRPPMHSLAKKIQESKKPWWTLAFELDCKRGKEPDRREVGKHPAFTPDNLVNRFIGESAIRLADHYHSQHIELTHGLEARSVEHDLLLQELAHELPSFARKEVSERFKEHQKIASTYRTIEPIRVAFANEALVLLGQSAFEEKLTGKTARTHLRGKDGKAHTIEDVQNYIKQLAKLPAFGEWSKAQAPARIIALARVVPSSDIQGIAFSATLTYQSFGMAQAAEKNTGSAVQDRLRRYLISEFDECPEFYFVLERGLGQLPHLHGAMSLDPSQHNQKRLRAVLIKLARAKGRHTPERWVDTEPLTTPARWAGYSIKHPVTSQSKTGVVSLLYATQTLRIRARDEWELMRQEQRDAKQVMKRVHASGK